MQNNLTFVILFDTLIFNFQTMNVQQAYNIWSTQYDTNDNKTRDLEALGLRETLNGLNFNTCLEVGCGTGKNTAWLLSKAQHITAIDISDKMLEIAKRKCDVPNVTFKQVDVTKAWQFSLAQFSLVTFSLMLEHIEDLDFIFKQLTMVIKESGYVYIGELHPVKQYAGTKARFETEDGLQVVPCFNHHISDFTQLGLKYGFEILNLNEFFDDNNKEAIPRILTILLRKKLLQA